MKNGFAQAMAWLHTWGGLLMGWLLFVVCVSGTISCFDSELDDWMRPALHGATSPEQPGFDRAITFSKRMMPDAHAWYIVAPGERERATEAWLYRDDGSYENYALDPRTGAPLPDTVGGDFFFTLHYNLHAGVLGQYIVGLAGMFMLLAVITGIVIHRRFFRDFFTFRPRAGRQRAWLDGHNLTGVIGLPFHLLMAYTGVIIFAAMYMTAGVDTAYDSDILKFYEEAGDSYERPEVGKPLATLASADALVADATRRLGRAPDWVNVHHTDDASATIGFGGDNSKHVGWDVRSVTYDAADGSLLHVTGDLGGGYDTYRFLGGLHMAQFGGAPLRWLYFLLGLSTCVMIACGMQVWVAKRAQKIASSPRHIGYRLVQGLNIGVVAGMPLACACVLIANRLLPAAFEARAQWEATAFCVVWAATALYGLLYARGWRGLFALTAVALGAIPLVNLATAPQSHLGASLARGDWTLAAVDLTVLALASGFAWLAHRAARRERVAYAMPATAEG